MEPATEEVYSTSPLVSGFALDETAEEEDDMDGKSDKGYVRHEREWVSGEEERGLRQQEGGV